MFQASAERYTMPAPKRKTKGAKSRPPDETSAAPSPNCPDRPVRIDPTLTLSQHMAVLEALTLAQEGILFGCDCLAKGKYMPCEHVMEAAEDEAIPVIREHERRVGHRGIDVLRAAGEELQATANPKDKKGYRASTEPLAATSVEPATLEKRKLLRKRIAAGQSVYCPGDKLFNPARCPRNEERIFNDED